MIKTIGNYTFSDNDEIGRGAFSRVYLANTSTLGSGQESGQESHGDSSGSGATCADAASMKSTSADAVAVKVIELQKMTGVSKHLLREIELMRHMHHPNIVQLINVQYERCGSKKAPGFRIYIVMDYCARGDMTAALDKPLDEKQCHHYFQQIFSGLRYLRKRHILHRDLKPQNILITADDRVKIADFTFSRQIQEDELMQTQCGTPLYLSPDVMFGEPYTDKSDLYSVGVMLYTYLYGSHPLGSVKSHGELMRKLQQRHRITFAHKLVQEHYDAAADELTRVVRHFSCEVVALLKGLLQYDPRERCGWEDIYTDPWLNLEPFDDASDLFPRGDTPSGLTENQAETIQSYSAPTTTPSSDGLIPRPREIAPVTTRPIRRVNKAHSTSPNHAVPTLKSDMFSMSSSEDTSTTPGMESVGSFSSRPVDGGASRLINDYYSISPDADAIPSHMARPARTISNNASRETSMSRNFLTRSIDAIQKVFSL